MTNNRIVEIKNQWKAANMENREAVASSLVIPVIYSGSSTDGEHIAMLLTGFMYAGGILKKTSPHHEDFLYFSVPYTDPYDKKFSSIQALYNHVKNSGGYYGSYRGVVLVDVTLWRGHFRERYFDIFLAYLADQRSNGLIPFIYTDYCDSEPEMQELEAVASSYFSFTRIYVRAKDFCDYAVSLLKDHGIGVDESARLYLEDFFQDSMKSVLFYGTVTVGRICNGVAEKCNDEQICSSLDRDHLKAIITELGYSEIYRDRPGKMMGFRA